MESGGARPIIRPAQLGESTFGQGPAAESRTDWFDVPGHYPERLSQPMQRGNPPPSGLNPDNTIEPPDTGTTPVIAPPGSPAGDRRIGPK